mgnify:CR=1 FL=1
MLPLSLKLSLCRRLLLLQPGRILVVLLKTHTQEGHTGVGCRRHESTTLHGHGGNNNSCGDGDSDSDSSSAADTTYLLLQSTSERFVLLQLCKTFDSTFMVPMCRQSTEQVNFAQPRSGVRRVSG